ncbi:ribonuclease T2 family protein [Thiomicrorhabdus indica]|uniref:ribonuclease T2 family protein n=1 Tax=Thiomicrorhabdus indica TaxID=2267253 RepID=UPI002AA8C8F9|nr:hypothetical protein [Thiomicrorhabdus indica]
MNKLSQKLGSLLLLGFALSANAKETCSIQQKWLNLNYDHSIDYQNKNVSTDFFLLMFSNSKRFCEHMQRKAQTDKVPFQCESPNQFGWVVHGLWSENQTAYVNGDKKGHPRFCKGDLPKVELSKMEPYLCMSPGTRLLQGEWEKHGACDFPTFNAYYQKTLELYQRFKMPPVHLKSKPAMLWMKKQHPELKNTWMHLTRNEFGICFDKQFNVMNCPKTRR